MKSITIELSDEAASLFEKMSRETKSKVALLATLFAKSKPKPIKEILNAVDEHVATSGLTEEEIDQMLDELS
jgi:hypothetical protein